MFFFAVTNVSGAPQLGQVLFVCLFGIETTSGKVGEAAERIADAVDNVSEVDPSFVEFLSLLADFYSDTLIFFSQDDCVIFTHSLSFCLCICIYIDILVMVLMWPRLSKLWRC